MTAPIRWPPSQFQSNWLDILTSPFMQHALIGGSLVALAAGLLGYFVITRQNAFAAHALAHIGFPGATGAILVGAPVTLGLAVFCVGGGLLIGLFGRRVADREMATGTILSLATALGVLFAVAGQRQRPHDDVGAVRQPAGDLPQPARRLRRVHRGGRAGAGRDRAAAGVRLGRPGRWPRPAGCRCGRSGWRSSCCSR